MYMLGALTIVLDTQGRILLCHRRDLDVWNPPGGGVECRELPTETVIREVHSVWLASMPRRRKMSWSSPFCAVPTGCIYQSRKRVESVGTSE